MLELRNIQHYYLHKKNQKQVIFENLNLKIKEGEISALLGPSGCGKTTLVNLIAGFLKPADGQVFLNNKEIKNPGRDRIVMSQEKDVFDWFTVYENMRLVTKEEDIINKYLDLVNLNKFKNSYPGELSGGMKKRLSLARALAIDPNFIIMDEPFSSLDQYSKENLYDEILNIFKDSKRTMLLVTHEIEEALYLAKNIYIVSHSPSKEIKELENPFWENRQLKNKKEFIEFKNKILNILKA